MIDTFVADLHINLKKSSKEKIKNYLVFDQSHFISQDIADKLQNNMLYLVVYENSDDIPEPKADLMRVVGRIIQIEVNKDSVKVKAKIYSNTPLTAFVENTGRDNFMITPVGYGTVIDGVVQDDYRLDYFALIPKPLEQRKF